MSMTTYHALKPNVVFEVVVFRDEEDTNHVLDRFRVPFRFKEPYFDSYNVVYFGPYDTSFNNSVRNAVTNFGYYYLQKLASVMYDYYLYTVITTVYQM